MLFGLFTSLVSLSIFLTIWVFHFVSVVPFYYLRNLLKNISFRRAIFVDHYFVIKQIIKMTKSIMRGALIVLEGCDRSGKTTQSTKLVEALNKLNIPARKISFPDRSTPIGSIINDYLSRKIELPDRSVHLLFSANRWELESEIRKQIEAGVTLIVDRYSYSGVVFTSAKQCIDFKWCCGPENGLPKPDLVMFLKLSSDEMAKRSGFGDERYENVEFQNKVDKNYDRFTNENFIQINAAQDISTLTNNLLNKVLRTIDHVKNKELDELVFN